VEPSGKERHSIDEEELGKTVQLLYDAFSLVESVGGSLSPYVPTQDYIVDVLLDHVEALAARSRITRWSRETPPVYYEPGCGTGRVAVRAASRGLYSVCVELDPYLAREAAVKARLSPLLDVAIGDLSIFRLRAVDVVYAYLLPRAVAKVLAALQGANVPVVSLDYPAEGDRGVLSLTKLDVMERSVFIYRS